MGKINFRNESGYTMLGVLFVFITLAVLGLSITTLSLTSLNTSASERDNQSAFYIAEAGLNKRMNELNIEIQEIYEKDTVTDETSFFIEVKEEINGSTMEYDEFEKVNQVQPKAYVTIDKIDGSDNGYYIESRGEIGDQSRTVSTTFNLGWSATEVGEGTGFPPFLIFTKGETVISGNKLIGDIGTINESGLSILQWPSIDGTIYVPNGDKNKVNKPGEDYKVKLDSISEDYSIPELPPFPNIPNNLNKIMTKNDNGYQIIQNNILNHHNWDRKNYTYKMEEDTKLDKLLLAGNIPLKIDIGDEDRTLVVNEFNNPGHIKLIGEGTLTIFVESSFKMSGTINDENDKNKLNIYYKGANPIKLANNSTLNGSIYLKNANFTTTGGAEVTGNIIVGGYGNEVNISGGAEINSQFVFAPYSHVKFSGGTENFKGKVISDSISMSGGWHLTYDANFNVTGPLSEQAIVEYNEGLEGGGGTGTSGDSSFNITRDSIKEVQ